MDEKMQKVLSDAYDFVKSLGYNVWAVNLYGSQNYKMDTPESDYDFKALVLPTFEQVVSVDKPVSKVYSYGSGQVDVKDVRVMFNEYKKQNCQYLETLFTDFYWVNPLYKEEWERVRVLAPRVARADVKRHLNAMCGMALEKAHALTHPYESKVGLLNERGYDSKQLSHAFRLSFMMDKYMAGEDYKSLLVPSPEELKLLMDLKLYRPQLSVGEATRLCKEKVDEMHEKKKNYLNVRPKLGVDEDTYAELDAVKLAVLRKVFREELLFNESLTEKLS